MKIAVLSDIHGNYPALEAVAAHIDAWQPDQVVVNGDIVNLGPKSVECWQLVETQRQVAGWHIVRGNHEDSVIADAALPRQQPRVNPATHWTAQGLAAYITSLQALPRNMTLDPLGHHPISIYHGSIRGIRDGVYPDTTPAELRDKIPPGSAAFCTGHTHIPLLRTVDDTLVVNSGSVGAPLDGNRRASYAQLHWHHQRWQAQIVRVPYDVGQAALDFADSGVLDTEPFMRLIYQQWLDARNLLKRWATDFRPQVNAGVLDEETAIDLFIEHVTR